MTYRERIAAIVPHVQPQIIEAWMRLEHGTLDALSPSRFRSSAEFAAMCAIEAGDEQNAALLRSYGL